MKLQVALLLVVMVSPLWIMPLSAPVVSDVVVVMHHDSAVNTAVRTIVANAPQMQVVEYGSLEYALTIHRTLGRVVWVSHGSEAGIVAQSHVLSWKAFSRRTELTPGKDIVLACDSAMINQYVAKDSVVGFSGAIDAILGGLITSLVLISATETLAGSGSILPKFLSRLTDILLDHNIPQFLDWPSESQRIVKQTMIAIVLTMTVCVISMEPWEIAGFISAAFTDFIVNVILAPLWAGWLGALLRPIIWTAVFGALFAGANIVLDSPLLSGEVFTIRTVLQIIGLGCIYSVKKLVYTFLKNAVIIIIGAYNNVAQAISRIIFDVIGLMLVLRRNVPSAILSAIATLKTIWDLAGLVVTLCGWD